MGRRKKIEAKIGNHLSYCAGKGWLGDGTKNTSPCPFNDSKYIESVRYVCHHCCTGVRPSDILADANGIHLENARPLPKIEIVEKRKIDRSHNKEKQTESASDTPAKRNRGRPKGSRNKPKLSIK